MLIYFYFCCVLILSWSQTIQACHKANIAISSSKKKLGSDIYHSSYRKTKNWAFSPLNLHAFLSLLYIGSKGKIEDLLQRNLQLPEREDTMKAFKMMSEYCNSRENVTLHIANKFYLSKDVTVKEKFKEDALKIFYTQIENINFKDRKRAIVEMNKWISNESRHKFPKIIKKVSKSAKMFAVNTLYFEGMWVKPFYTARKGTFYTKNDKKRTSMMMWRIGRYEIYTDMQERFEFVRLPFKDDSLNLMIVLPNESRTIESVEREIARNVEFFNLTGTIERIYLSIPKFTGEFYYKFNRPLERVGLKDIFGPLQVPNMTTYKKLKISQVFQGLFIDINERGIGIPNPTGARLKKTQVVQPIRRFIVNRPFLYYLEAIIEGIRHIIFQGKIEAINRKQKNDED